MKIKRFYFVIKKSSYFLARILLGVILSCLTIEIYLRIKYPMLKLKKFEDDNYMGLNIEGNRRLYRMSKDLDLGWEFDKNHPGVNSLGFFDKERNIKKSTDTYRIVVLGDSITHHGWYVRMLEQYFNDDKSFVRYKFDVWNCGHDGYNIKQYYALLKKIVKMGISPDMIIIGFCLNDIYSVPVVFKNRNGYFLFYEMNDKFFHFKANSALFIRSYFYRWLTLFWENSFYRKNENKELKEAERSFIEIKKICKENDIKLVAVIIPYFKSKYEYSEKESYIKIKQYLEKYSINYIDLHGKFKNIDDLSWRLWEKDYIHPNEKGHEIIADEIYKYLKDDLLNKII